MSAFVLGVAGFLGTAGAFIVCVSLLPARPEESEKQKQTNERIIAVGVLLIMFALSLATGAMIARAAA